MSHGRTRYAIARTAKQRNLLWTLPAILFFVLGLGFLAIFAINYIDSLLKGGHYLLLVISSTASPFLTLGIFSLILGGVFKLCGYLASVSYLKLYERPAIAPLPHEAAFPEPEPEPAPPAHENPSLEAPAKGSGPPPDDL
jgi:hypothetical protein